MLFNSLDYLIFLPCVLVLYWISGHSLQNKILLAASYLFYGLWDIRFLFLIVLSTGVDYLVGLLIHNGRLTRLQYLKSTLWVFLSAIAYVLIDWPEHGLDIAALDINPLGLRLFPILIVGWVLFLLALGFISHQRLRIDKRKVFVAISVTVNLSILGFFKYFNFFIDSAGIFIESLGFDPDRFYLEIVLPVGISFYTFQTISYSIDIYRKEVKPTEHFLDFALFVAFFPQLVAGPIERAKNLLPRLLSNRRFDTQQVSRGLFLISWGMFKKIAIADSVAASVDSVYNTTGSVSWLDVVLATFLFALQIYCDFSAYSDIARGSAKLMGIELMRNFNLPYFSTNPSEFWRRWHISLSSWLRDYLYIPLGGSRGSSLKTYRNLGITMLLGGLWHGAAWNFILWGAYQGAILSIHRHFSRGKSSVYRGKAVFCLKVLLFFIVTCYGWLLFRANSMEQVLEFSRILLFEWSDFSLNMKRVPLAAVMAIPVLMLYEFCEFRSGDIRFYRQLRSPVMGAAIAYGIFVLLMGLSSPPVQFIYFQF